jgi:hypothetical protein
MFRRSCASVAKLCRVFCPVRDQETAEQKREKLFPTGKYLIQ